MVFQEQVYQVGVELVAGPARGENLIKNGPGLPGKLYEINPRLIAMIKENIFQGDATECPYEHIDNFDLACGTLQLHELTNGELKSKVFPYSLQGAAKRWLRCQDINTLSSWPKLLAAFSSYYFPQMKLYTIRRKISSFGQREGEKLVEAYIRYRQILLSCPEHHYPDFLIVNFFYGELNSQSKQSLYLASKGSFLGPKY
jgi:hypothetical protein